MISATAVIASRNDGAYLGCCLRNLVENDISFVVIDNDSTDGSSEICRRSEFAGHLVDVVDLEYEGAFSLSRQLEKKMEIVGSIESDWVIHLDVDEVLHPYQDGVSLRQALDRIDAAGWTVVNCDEFVFLPVDQDYVPDLAGPQPLLHYYFFEPSRPRLMRAWRRTSNLSLLASGGHLLAGSDVRLAPETMALRHYIVRNQEHAFRKYANRMFASEDLAMGWHRARMNNRPDAFLFPPAEALKRLEAPDARDLDRSDPWHVHYWMRALVEAP
jgi:glycosyltransferase involved in cell wall biosynthesis